MLTMRALLLAGIAAAAPLSAGQLADPHELRESQFIPPAGPMVLTRTVWRELGDGAAIKVARTYRITITSDGDGYLVDGQPIATTVDAPKQVAALAEIEGIVRGRTMETLNGDEMLGILSALLKGGGHRMAAALSAERAKLGELIAFLESRLAGEVAASREGGALAEGTPVYVMPYSSFICNYGKVEIEIAGEPVLPSPLVQLLQLSGAGQPGTDARVPQAVQVAPTARPQPVGTALPLQQLSATAYEDLRRCPYRFFALRQLGLKDDDARVNRWGGAIALGHPLGASGARLATTAVSQLHATGGRYALCTMCIGVGQGIAVVLERV